MAPRSGVGAAADALHCQWCMQDLPAGQTVCPSCGSPGVPDPRLAAVVTTADPTLAAPVGADLVRPELVEWWRDDEGVDADGTPKLTAADVEERRTQTFIAIGVAVAVCISLGWLSGPLLAPLIERLTGSKVEHPSDLRGAGAFLGTLVGMFIGATGGWIIWSGK
jgi:hypothetical protein